MRQIRRHMETLSPFLLALASIAKGCEIDSQNLLHELVHRHQRKEHDCNPGGDVF